jgi:hypothetical protein
MLPVGAAEVVTDVPDDQPVVDEVTPDATQDKPAARRRPAARKPERAGG